MDYKTNILNHQFNKLSNRLIIEQTAATDYSINKLTDHQTCLPVRQVSNR